jgi:hypothetical protein
VGTTQERLRKAEAVFKTLFESELNCKNDKAQNSPTGCGSPQIDFGKRTENETCQAIEVSLRRIGLGIEQIQQKSLNGLKNAMIMLNACIRKPQSYLGVDSQNGSDEINFGAEMMAILIARKIILLERYCGLMCHLKMQEIRKILGTMDNEAARKAIEKRLIQLVIKDRFVIDECKALSKFSVQNNIGFSI